MSDTNKYACSDDKCNHCGHSRGMHEPTSGGGGNMDYSCAQCDCQHFKDDPAPPSGEEEARAWWESLTIEQLGIKAEEASIWNVLKLMPKILAAYAAHRDKLREQQ